MNFFVKLSVLLFLSLFIFEGVFAVVLDRNSLGTTYSQSNSSNYDLHGGVGDPFVGRATSPNYIIDSGLTMFVTGTTPNICDTVSGHCSDGIKNCDEAGVDCGGIHCSACDSGGGGGGGGGSTPVVLATVHFSGIAYPGAKIFLLRDGVLLNTFFASSTGIFNNTLTSLTGGNYRFILYAQDIKGGYSTQLVFPLTVISGNTYQINAIFIPPTAYYDLQEVKQGDPLPFYGYSAPNSTVILEIKNKETGVITNFQTIANNDGYYLYNLDTSSLAEGSYEIKIKSRLNLNESPFTNNYPFVIGTTTIEKPVEKDPRCPQKGDVNNDCRVNLIDFSITAYWYKRSISQQFLEIEATQLSGDAKIDLVDFSILAYYWTG